MHLPLDSGLKTAGMTDKLLIKCHSCCRSLYGDSALGDAQGFGSGTLDRKLLEVISIYKIGSYKQDFVVSIVFIASRAGSYQTSVIAPNVAIPYLNSIRAVVRVKNSSIA